MEKNYEQMAYNDAGHFEHDDLISLIANLYERLDQLGALEIDFVNNQKHEWQL